jgi:uncharacterized membrane protein YhaH (DUF805 family)
MAMLVVMFDSPSLMMTRERAVYSSPLGVVFARSATPVKRRALPLAIAVCNDSWDDRDVEVQGMARRAPTPPSRAASQDIFQPYSPTRSWHTIRRMEAIRWFRTVVTKHYYDFGGRARPAEFWWYMLVFLVIDVVLALIQNPFHTRGLTALLGVVLFAPTVGVEIRRLHDIGKSGWWLLMAFVPFIGGILLIYWWTQPGTSGPNKFGADPLEGAAGATARA